MNGDAERFDAVVIGAGSAGLTVAVGLARLGRRVALVEGAEVGGDCTNAGCIPSKTLIALARELAPLPPAARASAAAEALAATRARRDAVRAHEEAWLAELPTLTLVRGRARLQRGPRGRPDVVIDAGPDASSTPPRRLRAPRVVLATGSRPALPDVAGLRDASVGADPAVRTSATLFDLTAPPAHLCVLGAGSVGSELAFAFARLGSRVTLIEAADRVLPASEAAASDVVRRRLERLGVDVRPSTTVTGFDADAQRVTLAPTLPGVDDPDPLEGVDRLFVAVGRRPDGDDLGLDDVGVRRDGRGSVIVDGAYRTTCAGVYAIGDLVGAGSTHVANAQGRRLVRFLTLPLPLLPPGDAPSVAFTEPEVAQIGPTLATLRRRLPDALLAVHAVPLASTDRGVVDGLDDGFVQLVAMRFTGRLLAATVVAPAAGEMLPLLVWAQRRRVSLWQLGRLVLPYPTLSEAIRSAADAFVFGSLPRLASELATYLRWRWWRGPRG